MPDPSVIHELGIDFDAAWNARDAAAVGGLFLDDADLQVPRGDMFRGREQIEQYYTSAFANMPPDRRHSITFQHVRFLTSEVAIGDGPALILRAGAAADEEPYLRVLFTSVARNQHGQWRIAALTDRSGDYDPKDELLELEFTVSEQGSRRMFRASVTTIVLLRKGEVFSGEITEVSRTTARVQRVAALALSGLVTAFAATLFYRCGR